VRRYDRADEEKLRLLRLVREWTRAGLLDAMQGQQLEQDLRVDLRRTGAMLRAGLALFTGLFVAASVGLTILWFNISDDVEMAGICALVGGACFVAADRLAVRFRFYRHGVEEALAVASCVLLAIGAAIFTSETFETSRQSLPVIAALAVGAAAASFIYRWFGFLYAAIGAVACVALIPFQLSVGQPVERLLSATVLLCAFAVAHAMRGSAADAETDDAESLQAAAFGGLSVVVNLYLTHVVFGTIGPEAAVGWFRWTTYGLIWTLAPVGLWIGIRSRNRWLLDVAIAAALGTLVSNKPYLGLAQRPWDPILFGALLIVVGVGLRRWLSNGPEGERAGFTANQILASERDLIHIAQIASAGVDIRSTPASHESERSGFEGGRSGGGGGGAGF
jgi:hypothetical protein